MFSTKNIEKLKNYQSKFPETNPINFLEKKATLVMMEEYAITNATDSSPVLGSFGASACLILAIRDNLTTTTLLTHITTMTILSSLEELLGSFDPDSSTIHLIGGMLVANTCSFEMCLAVINIIEHLGFSVANTDVVRNQKTSGSMAIDARTGEVFSPVTKTDFAIPFDFNRRLMQSISLNRQPLKRIPTYPCPSNEVICNTLTKSLAVAVTSPHPQPSVLIINEKPHAMTNQLEGGDPINQHRMNQMALVSTESIFKVTKKAKEVSFLGLKSGFLLR